MYNEGDPGVKNNVYYRILTLVASVCVCVQLLSCVQRFVTPWTAELEKAMAPHSRILAWKIPWTEEPGQLQSMGLRRVGHN